MRWVVIDERDHAPHHASQSLSHDVPQIITDRARSESSVELVGVVSPLLDLIVKGFLIRDGDILLGRSRRHLESNDDATSVSGNVGERVVSARLGSFLVWVDELPSTLGVTGTRRRRRGRGMGILVVIDVDRGTFSTFRNLVDHRRRVVRRKDGGSFRGRLERKLGEVGRRLRLGRSMRLDDMVVETILDVERFVLSSVKTL